jgi:DNA polymerase II small subunit/DNA polymerase delta subunit B
MLLSPTNTTRESSSIHSLLIMTGKMLPRLTQHDRRGAFVDMISSNLSDITNVLGEREYETKVTHQHKYSPPARPCGEGVYEIILHGSSPKHTGHTHFIYELELPDEPG